MGISRRIKKSFQFLKKYNGLHIESSLVTGIEKENLIKFIYIKKKLKPEFTKIQTIFHMYMKLRKKEINIKILRTQKKRKIKNKNKNKKINKIKKIMKTKIFRFCIRRFRKKVKNGFLV